MKGFWKKSYLNQDIDKAVLISVWRVVVGHRDRKVPISCVDLSYPHPCPVTLQTHWHPKAAVMDSVQLPLALQENVSCLNTSLVILMLARRKERLPLYLRLLQRMEHSKKYPGFLLNNFHNLLRFWQQHYLHKDKDSTCLENVSASALSDGGRTAACEPQTTQRGVQVAPLWTGCPVPPVRHQTGPSPPCTP